MILRTLDRGELRGLDICLSVRSALSAVNLVRLIADNAENILVQSALCDRNIYRDTKLESTKEFCRKLYLLRESSNLNPLAVKRMTRRM